MQCPAKPAGEFWLAHLSDLHCWTMRPSWETLSSVQIRAMFSTWLYRSLFHPASRARSALAFLKTLPCDHILVTGDLTSTATEREFRAARDLLAPILADPDRVTVLPGNHDRYTARALRERRFERHFGDCCGGTAFPVCRQIGPGLVLIGLDSTQPSGWIASTGRIDAEQLRALDNLLGGLKAAVPRPFVIVANHYPVTWPAGQIERGQHRLENAAELLAILQRGPVDLYLHGHKHFAAYQPVDDRSGIGWAASCPGSLTHAMPVLARRSGLRLYRMREKRLAGVITFTLANGAWDAEALDF